MVSLKSLLTKGTLAAVLAASAASQASVIFDGTTARVVGGPAAGEYVPASGHHVFDDRAVRSVCLDEDTRRRTAYISDLKPIAFGPWKGYRGYEITVPSGGSLWTASVALAERVGWPQVQP